LLQVRQFPFHDQPSTIQINTQVVVHKHIAESGDFVPIDFGMFCLGSVR
jgi:hypothetical protein